MGALAKNNHKFEIMCYLFHLAEGLFVNNDNDNFQAGITVYTLTNSVTSLVHGIDLTCHSHYGEMHEIRELGNSWIHHRMNMKW